eukprot:7390658-Prymnesium_polylepis.1
MGALQSARVVALKEAFGWPGAVLLPEVAHVHGALFVLKRREFFSHATSLRRCRSRGCERKSSPYRSRGLGRGPSLKAAPAHQFVRRRCTRT